MGATGYWLALQEGTIVTLVDGPYASSVAVVNENNKREQSFGKKNNEYIVVKIQKLPITRITKQRKK